MELTWSFIEYDNPFFLLKNKMTIIHSNNMQQQFGVEDDVIMSVLPYGQKCGETPLGKKTNFSAWITNCYYQRNDSTIFW